jgi:hypothetical protein
MCRPRQAECHADDSGGTHHVEADTRVQHVLRIDRAAAEAPLEKPGRSWGAR